MSDLEDFLNNDDPNAWWRLSTGQMQNLFDEAVDERDALQEQLAESQAANKKLVEALEAVRDSQLLSGLAVLHDEMSNIVYQALTQKP